MRKGSYPRAMARESEKGGKEVRDEAEALAREMARDVIELTRVSWRLMGQVGRMALRTAEEVASEAERGLERERERRARSK